MLPNLPRCTTLGLMVLLSVSRSHSSGAEEPPTYTVGRLPSNGVRYSTNRTLRSCAASGIFLNRSEISRKSSGELPTMSMFSLEKK